MKQNEKGFSYSFAYGIVSALFVVWYILCALAVVGLILGCRSGTSTLTEVFGVLMAAALAAVIQFAARCLCEIGEDVRRLRVAQESAARTSSPRPTTYDPTRHEYVKS